MTTTEGAPEGFRRAVEQGVETRLGIQPGLQPEKLPRRLVGPQHVAVLGKDEHAFERRAKQIGPVMEAHRQRPAQLGQHAVFDGPGGDGEGFENGHRVAIVEAGRVEHAGQLARRVEERHGGTGKGQDFIQKMLPRPHHHRPPFGNHAGRAVGADGRLADIAAHLEDAVEVVHIRP